ncbi:hypothetical protein MKC48_04090 [[Clostridium] innocuum]|nr:hypothetical protein [[Clostridium] innocuum]
MRLLKIEEIKQLLDKEGYLLPYRCLFFYTKLFSSTAYPVCGVSSHWLSFPMG